MLDGLIVSGTDENWPAVPVTLAPETEYELKVAVLVEKFTWIFPKVLEYERPLVSVAVVPPIGLNVAEPVSVAKSLGVVALPTM